jgi:hypothetical protein
MTTQDHQTPEQIEAEIAAQRAQLADTVDRLTDKLDLKAQAKSRLSRVGPSEVAIAVGLGIVLGTLVRWRRSP